METAKASAALAKYIRYYDGINPNQLATYTQALSLAMKIIGEWPQIGYPSQIVAIPSGMMGTVANHTPAKELIDDGFPTGSPANYHLVYGEKKEDEYEGNTRNVNVALALITPPAALYLEIKPKT